MKVILGSSSPRRKIILGNIIEKLEIISPQIEEKQIQGEKPIDFSLRISKEKNISIIENTVVTQYPSLIITSDTIVELNNKILGKPSDFDDAVNTLTLLSNNVHNVITGISLSLLAGPKKVIQSITDYEITSVKFRKLSGENITDYLKIIKYNDKAGAYAYQEHGSMIIEDVNGSITNIIGFPLRLFFRMINEISLWQSLF
ncbi:nucleoside triphosphate pyrophosphatase [Spirochaetota bacterium]